MRQTPSPRTVQGVLEEALAKVTRETIRLVGAGRTDSGVHALGQVVAFSTKWRHSLTDLYRAWNAVLPEDVAIVSLDQAEPDFHPRFDATSRIYRYVIWNHPVRNPLVRRAALWVPQSLEIDSMNAALDVLVGEHDFATFGSAPRARRESRRVSGDPAAAKSRQGRTVRRVYGAVCERTWRLCWTSGPIRTRKPGPATRDSEDRRPDGLNRPDDLERLVCLDIEANAFLYRMVRSIVGTVLQVGRGQLSVPQFAGLFSAADRSRAGPTAPPHGLCLMAVRYSERGAVQGDSS